MEHTPLMQQPMQELSSVVIIQPSLSNMSCGEPQNMRDWNSGLFDCLDDCIGCLCRCRCLCCTICRIANRMDESWFVPFFICGGTAMRTKIRAQYGIRGSICHDCCTASFCGTCAMFQMDRELKCMGTAIKVK